MRRQPLNERQLEILQWVADGYLADRYEGEQHKQTARALENRRLVRVARKAGVWTAELTDAGRFYLDHGRYDEEQRVESSDVVCEAATR